MPPLVRMVERWCNERRWEPVSARSCFVPRTAIDPLSRLRFTRVGPVTIHYRRPFMPVTPPLRAFGRALVVALVVATPGVARADQINIGLGWQVTAPAGYLPQPAGPLGQLENF